jgi:methylase of polypeptide subunit release factors
MLTVEPNTTLLSDSRLPSLRDFLPISTYRYFFGSPVPLAPQNHEDELHEWKERYKDGGTDVFDGQEIVTDPDVFPAALGDTSRDIAFALRLLQLHHEQHGLSTKNKIALDMGCGNGALGMSVASLSSYSKVIAVDSHKPATDNAARNFEGSPHSDKLSVYHSDMMRDVPREIESEGQMVPLRFDLVVFNHPYYPREGPAEFGLGQEGGAEIIRRFFDEIEPFIHDETEIIMPYANDVSAEHDPGIIAEELGFSVSILLERIDAHGVTHRIYRFVKNDIFENTLPSTVIREKQPAAESSQDFALAA